jgi:ABC-type lipoprotein release transport system permease subunit
MSVSGMGVPRTGQPPVVSPAAGVIFSWHENGSPSVCRHDQGSPLARFLYQVSPADPLALLIASSALAAAALLACFLPARRATRVRPMSALRSD